MANTNESKIYSFSVKPNNKVVLNFDENITPPFSIGGKLNGNIEYNFTTNKIEYIPEKDFSGLTEFTLTFGQDENQKIIQIQVANTFKHRARIIKIIGQELISNDVIALVELIKNSFDADAQNIDLTLNNIFSNDGEIIIKDDGSGMTYEKIINVWLEPATPDKKSKNNNTFSKCFQRRLLGEKGIGRFAVHRLGNKIELITRSSNDCGKTKSNYETKVEIDWNEFTDEKYLDEIPVKIVKNETPEFFKEDSGTYIRISDINPWKNTKAVKDAIIKIRSLESPVKPKQIIHHKQETSLDPGAVINVITDDNELQKEIKNIKSLKDLLKTAFYKFNAIVDENGEIKYDYSFNRPDYQDIKRTETSLKDDLKKYKTEWFEEHQLTEKNSPGLFEVNFFAWDLETASLKVAGLAHYYKNIIKPNAGIRIYRDNFRVWPYGEPDEDWLNLDLTRLNAPSERSVSRNQVFGAIHISSIENPNLKDQSNREGLIISEQYEQFYQLVSSALSVFARERKKDKIKMDKTTETKKVFDSVTETLSSLKNKVEKNNHSTLYNSDIDNIEKTYKTKINDILERYMMAAAIGISYSIPIHEMKLRLTSIKHVIDDLEKNPLLQDLYLRQLADYVKETDDIIKAVTSIMSRQKRQSVDLRKVANNVKILKESDLKKYNIEYEIISNKDIFVEAVPGLLNTAVLNIVDNSIYWLRTKHNLLRQSLENFQPKITIELDQNEENRSFIRIKDNGTGFEDPFDLLVEPYYSRKSDGLGLGLYLVNEIMIRNGGRINGYNDGGAVIDLIF
jgi:signal transduction histidine kinase